MAVRFNFQAKTTLKQRNAIKAFIVKIFSKEKKKLKSLDYVFCDDNYLLDINRKYLQHDFYTDILSFDLSSDGNEYVSGEIYISIDTVKSNAHKYGAAYSAELLRVMFHGALHLCGYRDKTRPEKAIMTKKEDYYLTMFHVKYS